MTIRVPQVVVMVHVFVNANIVWVLCVGEIAKTEMPDFCHWNIIKLKLRIHEFQIPKELSPFLLSPYRRRKNFTLCIFIKCYTALFVIQAIENIFQIENLPTFLKIPQVCYPCITEENPFSVTVCWKHRRLSSMPLLNHIK